MLARIAAAARQAAELLSEQHHPIRQEGLEYHCALTAAKRWNLLLEMVSRPALAYTVPALPHILHVGVTTRCNLHCPACPTGNGNLGRAAVNLPYDVFARTVDELRDALLFVLFWDWGEPLLHPQLPAMIEHTGRSGIRTVVSTNGTVNNSEPQIERLVAAQPSVVIVCVDGATQEVYEKYRAGGKLSRVLDTLRRLRQARDRQQASFPLIEFRSLALKDNQAQMPDLLRMAESEGADLFSVKSVRPYDYRGANVDADLVPLEPALRRYSYREGQREAGRRVEFERLGPLGCGKPHSAPTLNSDGVLAFCSYATLPHEHFGPVAERGFRRLWKSERSREIRMRFAREGGTGSCDTCFFRTDQAPTILHQVPLRPFPPGIVPVWPKSRAEFLAVCGDLRPDAS